MTDRPGYYMEIFQLCAFDKNYNIIFEYNSGSTDSALQIFSKLS